MEYNIDMEAISQRAFAKALELEHEEELYEDEGYFENPEDLEILNKIRLDILEEEE